MHNGEFLGKCPKVRKVAQDFSPGFTAVIREKFAEAKSSTSKLRLLISPFKVYDIAKTLLSYFKSFRKLLKKVLSV